MRKGLRVIAIERACGVVVSRLLCMQKASGSNPDKSTSCIFEARWNGRILRLIKERDRTAAIAQLGERQTEDLEVPGSIPGLGMFFLRAVELISVAPD